MQTNTTNTDARSEAEETVRSILRRRREECLQGMPGSGPDELGELLNAYGVVFSSARAQLLRTVGRRAAAAFRGHDYQEAEDVLQDAFLKAWHHLAIQYNGEDGDGKQPSFMFDTEGKHSLVGWITLVIGNYNEGVLGAQLQRERRAAARFVGGADEADSEVEGDGSDLDPLLRCVDGPEVLLEKQQALDDLNRRLEALEPHERFAVETQLLYRVLGKGRGDSTDFWDNVESLVERTWTGNAREQPLAAVKALRDQELASGKPSVGALKGMLAALSNCAPRTVTRWFDDFLAGATGGATMAVVAV